MACNEDARELMLPRAAWIRSLNAAILLDAADSRLSASKRRRSTLEEEDEMLLDDVWLVEMLEFTNESELSIEDDEIDRLSDEALFAAMEAFTELSATSTLLE